MKASSTYGLTLLEKRRRRITATVVSTMMVVHMVQWLLGPSQARPRSLRFSYSRPWPFLISKLAELAGWLVFPCVPNLRSQVRCRIKRVCSWTDVWVWFFRSCIVKLVRLMLGRMLIRVWLCVTWRTVTHHSLLQWVRTECAVQRLETSGNSWDKSSNQIHLV